MEVTSYYQRERTSDIDSRDYFNKIYDRTYSEMLKFVIMKTSRADQVDDIIQNVYSNFYSRILRKGFNDIRFPEAFIIKLTEKELARHYKRTAIKKETETDLKDFDEQLDSYELSFDLLMEKKEALEAVRSIVSQLPLLSFKAFILFYYYDMSVTKIAEHLNISEQNVKTRLWRARKAVRKDLKDDAE